MTITNGYCTLAEYKAWIAVRGLAGSVGTDTSDDSSLEILIEAVSRYIDQVTGTRFYVNGSDEDRYYTPTNNYKLRIDNATTITTVSVDYTGSRSYTALTASDFDKLPDNAALDGFPYNEIQIVPANLSAAFFPIERRSVKITGKFGWSATTPTDIKDACMAITQSVNSNRSGQSSSGKITVTSAGVVIRPEDVPVFAQSIIMHYRDIL